MLSHSFDRFYVVTNFFLPTVDDFKFPPIDFDMECSYLNTDLRRHQHPTQYVANIRIFCTNIVPVIDFYKKQIDYYNKTVHDILTREMPLILANFPKNRKEKYNSITSNGFYWIGMRISQAICIKKTEGIKESICGYGELRQLTKKQNFSIGKFYGNVWH